MNLSDNALIAFACAGAQKTVDRYAIGSAIDGRCNPKRPGECVLEPRVPRGWLFAPAIAVGLLILAVHLY